MALKPFEQLPYDAVPDAPRLPHRWADTKAHDVEIDSAPFGRIRVHVRTYGHGPPLALVHGLMTSSYSWRYALAPLGERFSLVIPDLVGSGRSSKARGSYHPDRIAAALGETMRAMGAWGAPVIGNSMGGYLAMRLAMREPSSMSRLVDVHSPGIVTGRVRALAAVSMLPGAASLVKTLVARDPKRWVHKNVHYFDETLKSREEHAEYAAPLETDEGRDAFARTLFETMSAKAMRTFESELRAKSFPVPLRLVYARRDPMVPPVVGERLAALVPRAELVWLDDASHFAHVDATSAFVAAVMPFLCPSD